MGERTSKEEPKSKPALRKAHSFHLVPGCSAKFPQTHRLPGLDVGAALRVLAVINYVTYTQCGLAHKMLAYE